MKKILALVLGLTLAFTMTFALSGCGDPEKEAATEAFNAAVENANAQIEIRDTEVETARQLLDTGEIALDDSIEVALNSAIDVAASKDIEIPEMPKGTEAIKATTEELESFDVTKQVDDIVNMEEALKQSRAQYQLIVNPDENYIIEKLKTIKDIDKIEAVTEDHDPNNQLNKPGGYTSQVYFSSPLVKEHFKGDVIDGGTDCGGSIETYTTEDDANSRNDYLSSFDGGMFSSGSHAVYGTVIIRTSSYLKASEQKNLEQEIFEALTKLD